MAGGIEDGEHKELANILRRNKVLGFSDLAI
jgi:hypothetical protein